MDEMIGGIREVFVSNLQDLAWMDDETRKAAEEKASFIQIAGAVITARKIICFKQSFHFVKPDLCVWLSTFPLSLLVTFSQTKDSCVNIDF